MKKIVLLLSVAVLTFSFIKVENNSNETKIVKQTTSGIKFKNITLSKAKEMAKESGKMIFIDAYTSWCGPCKKMAATSFVDEEVGQLFNEKFINLKIDMEKDADGPETARLYKVMAYPTLLVIDADGKLIKQKIGFMTADQLISFANSTN